MTREEAEKQISLLENRISNNEDVIRDINGKISKLNELSYKIQLAKNKICDLKDDHIGKLNLLMYVNRKVKMFNDYHTDLRDILIGVKYSNAMEGFDSIKKIINQKVDELENQIQQLKNNISYNLNEISSLRSYTLCGEV